MACLEQHQDLAAAISHQIKMGEIMAHKPGFGNVAGTEDYQDKAIDAVVSIGRGLFSAGKWVGGKALDGFLKGFTLAGNQISKSFSENGTLIKNVLRDHGKAADKDLKLSAAKVSQITATGDASHILEDMSTLIKVLEQHQQHGKDVLAFLDKELVTLRKLKTASKAEQIHAVIEEFEGLKYPEFKLDGEMGKARKSEVLPGGRFIVFSNDGSPKYSFGGETPSGEGKSVTMSKQEIADILNKLDKVNDLHLKVKESYEGYAEFVKSWAEMVKGVDGNLSQLDKVSKTIIGECEKLMGGNQGALAFYSGFTPRVVGYTDKYIHGVLGVFA